MDSTSRHDTIGSGGERNREDEEAAPSSEAGNGSLLQLQPVVPEDGYEWKKYGQKFIKNIRKTRSYFRCRDKRCSAKKKVEWHPSDPGSDLRIVYDGAHQHGSPPSATGGGQGGVGGAPNQYELSAQYFGGARSQ